MTPDLFLELAVVPALSLLLPDAMDTVEARAFTIAIALQETGLTARRQHQNGPGRSYFQFEKAGISGVLLHPASGALAEGFCAMLDVRPSVAHVYAAIEFNDVLAVGFARLLLWTLPAALPGQFESDVALEQYLSAWRPGRPRPETWAEHYVNAWGLVGGSG